MHYIDISENFPGLPLIDNLIYVLSNCIIPLKNYQGDNKLEANLLLQKSLKKKYKNFDFLIFRPLLYLPTVLNLLKKKN